MTTIFISHRRKDDPYAARSINDALCRKFGLRNVYFDLDSLQAGLDWRKQIDAMVKGCDVMLVVIGDRWLQVDESGRSRLEDEDDLVRFEVSSALNREIPVIPVLVGNASIPAKVNLHEVVRTLYYRQAVEVRATANFNAQIENLLKSIEAVAPEAAAPETVLPEAAASQPTEKPVFDTEKPEFVDGQVFKDCDECPEMVVIPVGSFVMGGSKKSEQPQHRVTVPRFAMGKYAVTFDEYEAFADSTGKNLPEDRGWGRGNRPVINVTWDDAQAYAEWLSLHTGKRYRLPSEAEWEYSARAGTKWKYWWGDDIHQDGKVWANCDGCGSEWDKEKTAPVGSFAINPFGLYDTAGNAWEWLEDCWHDTYVNAPVNGSAWLGGDCDQRVIRGGSWGGKPGNLQSANRSRLNRDVTGLNVGFRLAQDLD